MPSGGYRKPGSPAAVSGQGSLSQRTDGGPADKQAVRSLPDAGYGEQAEFRGVQQSAPIGKAQAPGAASGALTPGGSLPLPLDAPSARPDEPVTFGADAGAGAGMEALGLLNEDRLAENDLKSLLKILPTLQYMADSSPNVPTSTLALIRYLRSQA